MKRLLDFQLVGKAVYYIVPFSHGQREHPDRGGPKALRRPQASLSNLITIEHLKLGIPKLAVSMHETDESSNS